MHNPTGYVTAASSETSEKLPAPQTISFSSAEDEHLGQCHDDLATCQNSVYDLKDIILQHCDRPHHDFEAAALETAKSREYSEDAFNCNYFSELLASRLDSMGYQSRIVQGLYKGEPHAWVVVEIPIEATSGSLITPQQYADYKQQG